MNATRPLQEILEDLYAIEPGLRAQEAALRALVERMIAARPDAPIDERFVEQLRLRLMASAPGTARTRFAAFLTGRSGWLLAPGLAVVGLALALSLAPRGAPAPASRTLALATGTERLGAAAFGPLSGQPIAHDGQAAAVSGPAPAAGAAMLAPNIGGGGGSNPAKMLVPQDWTPTYYKYVYKGEPIGNLTPTVDVYRRANPSASAGPIEALKGFDLGLVDLGKLHDASVQSFTVAENRQDGYAVSIDTVSGTISVSENAQWQHPERHCQDQACIDAYRVKPGDMPSGAETIRMADAMLDTLGISKDGYGTPMVHDEWQAQYLAAADKTSFWFPYTVTVVYPYVIDGKTAVDENGEPFGLNVDVDVLSKRGSSLWNLEPRRFQSSSYAAETDASRLIGIAEQGGLNGQGPMPDGAKVVEVDLGTPSVAYARVWTQDAGGGSELFAPTLVFPVEHPPQDFWQKSVSVPLAQDLLKVSASPGPVPSIQYK